MVSGALQKGLYRGLIATVVGISAAAAFTACGGGGDTDGGVNGPQAPGGGGGSASLGKLSILINDTTIPTGSEVGFRVKLVDANGRPQPNIRINCESERGIAIIEPSAGGVAFESTDANGEFSGRLGGITPGSYLIECRAPQGFNLYDRQTMIFTGDVPAGFTGWPGASGGNLGGGDVRDPDPTNAVRITSMTLQQGGRTGNVGGLDLFRNCNCAGATTSPMTAVSVEPFGGASLTVRIENRANQEFRIENASVTGIFSSPLTYSDDTNIVGSDSSGNLILSLADAQGACQLTDLLPSQGPTLSPALTGGVATVRVNGSVAGTDVTITGQVTVPVGDIDNCSN